MTLEMAVTVAAGKTKCLAPRESKMFINFLISRTDQKFPIQNLYQKINFFVCRQNNQLRNVDEGIAFAAKRAIIFVYGTGQTVRKIIKGVKPVYAKGMYFEDLLGSPELDVRRNCARLPSVAVSTVVMQNTMGISECRKSSCCFHSNKIYFLKN